jgi:hypothetical protein
VSVVKSISLWIADRIRVFLPMLDDLAAQCLILCGEVEMPSTKLANPNPHDSRRCAIRARTDIGDGARLGNCGRDR